MVRLAAVFLSFLFAVAANAIAAEPLARAPYRFDYGGWYTVSVTIDGQGPYDFIIDTGATHSLVFRNLAAIRDFPASGGPPQRVLGVSSAATLPTHVIGDIALGPVVLEDALCVILPDWTVDGRSPQGVLGLDFLAAYRLVFDAERREVLFYDAGAPAEPAWRRWSDAPLIADAFGQDYGELYTVEGTLDRKRARFLVDLGAAGTVINKPASGKVSIANQFRIKVNPPGGATRIGRLTDANDEEADVQFVLVDRFRIGGRIWMKRLFVVHDAEIFRELGVADKPFGLLGTDLLEDRSFVLDFPRRRMLIGPRAKS